MSVSSSSPSGSNRVSGYAEDAEAPGKGRSRLEKTAVRLGKLPTPLARFVERLIELLKIPPPSTPDILQRIETMERVIVLPIKVAAIAMLLQSFPWIGEASGTLDVPVEYARYFLWVYVFLNVVMAGLLFTLRRLPPLFVECAVFVIILIDGIFLGVMTLVTGGYNSILYWLFLALIIRSAVSVPRAMSQLVLNMTLSTCYVLAGAIDAAIIRNLQEIDLKNLEAEVSNNNPAEPLLLRLVLLLLMTFGCYAIQVLLERQRRAEEEAREFGMREGQLRAAGRLAAEFAHQIKNPLAIINTAAFSLQRSLRENKPEAGEQLSMIQEEIERADRIITQVMGYAQLSEGHVEKLNVLEELDRAIARVFPPAAHYPVQIHRSYGANFPPLLMQRRHTVETFINVLQNAREALGTRGGNVFVGAQCRPDLSIEVSISDDGPGIPKEKQTKVFEAYYTTKEKGTGLGLATVKHNVELYGGSVQLESELGKGARFILLFPAKTLMKLAKTI
jgi:signal transduction histidine kinase